MPRPGIFRTLGDRVMYGPTGTPGGPGTLEWYRTYTPVQYPVPPSYPVIQPQAAPVVNPAIRAEIQHEAKEAKEAADANPPKDSRKFYIPEWGNFLTKQEILDSLKRNREGDMERHSAFSSFGGGIDKEELLKNLARNEFGIRKQYKLSKGEPLSYSPGKFGELSGAASRFYNVGEFGKKQDGSIDYSKSTKAWYEMSPAEKDAFIAQEAALKNTPERLAKKEEQRREAQFREYEQQAQKQLERRRNMSPEERAREDYNREVAEYFEQQHRNEYQNQSQFINRNRQNQEHHGFVQDVSVPQPVMNELISMMNSQPVRYVPIRPRPSFNDRVMNSFGHNMFSPEFIPEEEE